MSDYILRLLNENLLLLGLYLVIIITVLAVTLDFIFKTKKKKVEDNGSIIWDILAVIGVLSIIDFFSSLDDELENESNFGNGSDESFDSDDE